MADIPTIVIEQLRAIRAEQDAARERDRQMTARLATLEGGQAVIIQHLAHLSSADAAQQLASDHVQERLERIERRLDIREQA